MQHTISGKVIKGDGYGRKLGFPTVNLDSKIQIEFKPLSGVYAGVGILENKTYKAGIVVDSEGKIEAHLIGYVGNAYGTRVTLVVKKFIRKFKKFKTEKELIAQIKKDLKICSQA